MADDAPPRDDANLPPKIDLRKQGILKPPAAQDKETPPAAAPERTVPKETSRFEVPPAAPADQPAPAAPDGKRDTSRIPLEQAKPVSPVESKPKTIRIKPVLKTGQPSAPPLRIKPSGPVAAPGPAPEEDAKRQTSRIPLESALTGAEKKAPGGEADDESPRTIKIRRPTRPGTVKLKQPGGETQKPPRPEQLMETSRLDAAAADAGSPTQKKTIKVKRPATVSRLKLQGGAARPAAPVIAPPIIAETEDKPGWFYGVAGVAAVLVLGALIWMQLAQAIGPNVSLTELSYARNAVDLPWPGKL